MGKPVAPLKLKSSTFKAWLLPLFLPISQTYLFLSLTLVVSQSLLVFLALLDTFPTSILTKFPILFDQCSSLIKKSVRSASLAGN